MDRYFNAEYKDRLIFQSSGFRGTPVGENLEDIEKLALDLPDVDYILDNIVNYMFTNYLTTESFEKDSTLRNYLYDHNFNGQRNYDVLKQVAKGYRKYGYYGILNTGEGLVGVHPKDILACVIDYPRMPVLRQTLTYLIKNNNIYMTPYEQKTGNPRIASDYSEDDIKKILENPEDYKNEVMVVTDDVFTCVRLDTSQVFCMSPLLKDRKRVELILNILNRMNYDISRNGIGTIALQAKDTLEEQIEESVEQGTAFSGGELLDMGRTAKAERTQKIVEDMNAFADKLSQTEFNDAIVYSGNFQNLEQLERDTKATDFLDYLSQYVPAIICQMFGVPARLFDLNKTVSNIGTYSIIDNAMKNTIIPMRDHFLGQIVHLLQNATGLTEHIKFDSYEFTNNYNYNNDLYILDVYDRLKGIDEDMAEAYLKKNLIV
nr:MAG TPA: HK97 Family Phage Portal Protein [Caudoviricetes sp.]